jgi:hypothetical protein
MGYFNRFGPLVMQPAGSSLVYAPALITASGISDATIEAAIEDFEIEMTGYGLLSLMHAIYLIYGADAAYDKWNFMDAQDDDAAFRITWAGGVTHNSDGVVGNGSNAYGDTHIASSSVLSRLNKGLTIRVSGTSSGIIGNNNVNNSSFDGIFVDTTSYLYLSDLNNITDSRTSGPDILTICRQDASDLYKYKNSASWGTNPVASAAAANQNTSNIELLRANAQYTTGATLSFAAVHEYLDATQVANFHTAIDNFNNAIR